MADKAVQANAEVHWRDNSQYKPRPAAVLALTQQLTASMTKYIAYLEHHNAVLQEAYLSVLRASMPPHEFANLVSAMFPSPSKSTEQAEREIACIETNMARLRTVNAEV
jgi:hypothetical protein